MPHNCICIACLSSNIKMCFIIGDQLPGIYEKLANNKLLEEDGIPKTLCYICYSQLERCCRFINMSQKAGKILTQLLSSGVQITQETVSALEESTANNFVTTALEPISVPSSCNYKEDTNTEASSNNEVTIATDEGIYETKANLIITFKKEPPQTNEDMDFEEELVRVKEEPKEPTTSAKIKEEIDIVKYELSKKLKAALKDHVKGEKSTEALEAQAPKVEDSNMVTVKKKSKKKINVKCTKKDFVCNCCGRSFTKEFYLNRHLLIHTGEKPFACKICDKKFSQNAHLRQHMRVHTGEKPYTCDICTNKSFNHRYNFKTHMRRKHHAIPTHACNICGSAFHQKGDLKRHMMAHTGEKPYACTICQAKFSQNVHLRKHITIHALEKPYACDICQEKFAKKTHLNNHILIHKGGKLYQCSFEGCSRSFQCKSTLAVHVRVHTGEKPYSCDKCNRTFRQKGHLTVHTRDHAKQEKLADEFQQNEDPLPLSVNVEEFIIP